jgi:streptogramin lyase
MTTLRSPMPSRAATTLTLAASMLLGGCGAAASGDGTTTRVDTSATMPSAVAVASPTTPPTTPAPTLTPNSTAKPLGPHVVAQWSVANPSFLAFGFGSVWVTDHHNHEITRIDPVSNTVVAVIKGTGSNPEDALEVGSLLWVTGQSDDMVLIDPATNTVTRTIKGDHLFMDYGFKSVWITTRDNHLERFDPTTAAITASIPVGKGEDDCMNDIAATATAVWVISCDTGELIKVDPAANKVVARLTYASLIQEGTTHTAAPAGKGTDSIWLTLQGDEGSGGSSGLLRVDPVTGTGSAWLPMTPDLAGDGFNAITDEAVWLAGSEKYSRVDAATNKISATYPTGSGRLKIGVAFGSVWLRNYEMDLIQRLDVQP